MSRYTLLLVTVALTLGLFSGVEAQQWRPPSAQMPTMPSISELSGDWLTPRSAWFGGTAAVTGVDPSQLRASGEARPGSDRAGLVRFSNGPIPVVVWQDRNGDDRADMIEMYRGTGMVLQLIDADYDGRANVLRVYDANGTLLREDRL